VNIHGLTINNFKYIINNWGLMKTIILDEVVFILFLCYITVTCRHTNISLRRVWRYHRSNQNPYMRSVMCISYCLHDWQTIFIILFSSFWTVDQEKICWIVPIKFLLLLDRTTLIHFRSSIDRPLNLPQYPGSNNYFSIPRENTGAIRIRICVLSCA
jgi:hypothetical protein